MFNVSQLHSVPQLLRANFHYVNYNELAFTTMKKKKTDPRLFDQVSYRILVKKYKHLQRKIDQWLVSWQYYVANFIFSVKYRQRKVDINAGEKSLVFVTKRHRKIHLYAQLWYTKNSYLRKNTHLRKDAAFLHFRLKESSESMIFP